MVRNVSVKLDDNVVTELDHRVADSDEFQHRSDAIRAAITELLDHD